jgi:Leucine-rich repeat (LRR) protein
MKNYKFITILIILKLFKFSISTPLSPGNCPEECTCDLTDNVLRISACNQTNTPFTLPADFILDPGLADVTSIHAVGCLIQEFPTNICLYQYLTFINLALNQITSLSSSNFDCIQGLTKINLASNRIGDINEIFSKLENLSVLNLENNSISQITEAAFNNLKSLDSLDLSYNHIKSLPSNVFKDLSNLQQLDLSYNNITQIDDNYFNGLFKIKSLYLSNNQITKLSGNSFNSLNSLKYLFLSNNQINQSLNSLFINLINLIELDLSSNQMTTMELWPTYLPNLSVLLLRFNKIEKFTNELAWSIKNSENLPQLQDFIVDLEFNNIAELSDETMTLIVTCGMSR